MMSEKEKNRFANEVGAQVMKVVQDEVESLCRELESITYRNDISFSDPSYLLLSDVLQNFQYNLDLRKQDLEEAARTA